MQVLLQQDARLYSTFRLPALLSRVYLLSSVAELLQQRWAEPPLVLGEGSNSIFLSDIQQPVLRYTADSLTVTTDGDFVKLHVEAGHNWHQLVDYCVEQGWWGLENLALIPGSAGAAPVQNIGAYGVELSDSCMYVDFFHWQSQSVQRLSNAQCRFGYRDSIFKQQLAGAGVIVALGLQLSTKGQAKLSYRGLDHLSANCAVADVFEAVIAVRRSKLPDPAELANCGSFFKNPLLSPEAFRLLKQQFPQIPAYPQPDGQLKTAAAWLIEQAGFKGKRLGGIGCYDKQPLVLVNYGNGNTAELLQWVAAIVSEVRARFGITLEPEVRMLDGR